MDDYMALIAHADRCRRLARGLFDQTDVDGLRTMAREFEDLAAAAANKQLSTPS